MNNDLPATVLTTSLEWDDLILPASTLDQVQSVAAWIEHRATFAKDPKMKELFSSGYRALFHGPPGTGKTLTAALLGKRTGKDVYRIDLSMIVSKWIGETEKNLARVFDQAEGNDWILFFDDADALFGKRTEVLDANNRYANQETAYLLQRIEDFSGVVILAINQRGNIDHAFARRFQSIVDFTRPAAQQRLALWRQAFEGSEWMGDDIDLQQLADEHELTGADIRDVIRHAVIRAARDGRKSALAGDIRAVLRDVIRDDGLDQPPVARR